MPLLDIYQQQSDGTWKNWVETEEGAVISYGDRLTIESVMISMGPAGYTICIRVPALHRALQRLET